MKIYTKVVLCALLLSSCGQQSQPSSTPRPALAPAAAKPVAADPGPDHDLLAAIDLQTRASEGQVAGSCLNILVASGQDLFSYKASSSGTMAAVYQLTTLKAQDLKEAHANYVNKTNGWDVAANFSKADVSTFEAIGSIDKTLGGALSGNSKQSQGTFNYDDSFARLSTFLSTNQSAASQYANDVLVTNASMSDVGAAAYTRCITARSIGFTCEFEEEGPYVSLHLMWAPHELIRDKLPTLSTKLVTHENLTMIRESFPSKIGIGSGEIVAFKKVNKSKLAVIQIVGTDATGTLSFQCSNFNK